MPQPKPNPAQWTPLDKQHQYAFDLEQVSGHVQIEGERQIEQRNRAAIRTGQKLYDFSK